MSEKIFYLGNFGEKIESSEDRYIKKAEMFSLGTHRGVTYTEEDIDTLVTNFSDSEDVPVQIDHSESALHTVGYIRKVFSEGGKMMGELEILDESIQKRIDKGLMKKLSVSFYLQQTDNGLKPYKLREVSLVAFPQVKGARLFSENGYVSEYNESGGTEMVKETKEKEQFSEELIQKAKEHIESDLLARYNQLEERLEKLSGIQEKFTETQVSMKVEKFQEENKMVPAQRDALSKLLGTFSEEQAQLFDEFMSNQKTIDLNEEGEFEEQDGDQEKDKRTQEQKDFDNFYEEYANKFGRTL